MEVIGIWKVPPNISDLEVGSPSRIPRVNQTFMEFHKEEHMISLVFYKLYIDRYSF